MIRKSEEYQKALSYRKKGKSIRQIARLLKISPSTASIWCKPILLTSLQQQALLNQKSRIFHLRRLAKQSHLKKVSRVKKLIEEGSSEISSLSDHELFLTGLALYWAEGFKSLKEMRLGFCNSDPRMINFIIHWFKRCLKINPADLILRAEFNESHKDRKEIIENFWSKITKIPLNQFEKPYYQHSNWLRVYPGRDSYYGVLRIRVRRSSELLNKTRGWIEGLSRSA